MDAETLIPADPHKPAGKCERVPDAWIPDRVIIKHGKKLVPAVNLRRGSVLRLTDVPNNVKTPVSSMARDLVADDITVAVAVTKEGQPVVSDDGKLTVFWYMYCIFEDQAPAVQDVEAGDEGEPPVQHLPWKSAMDAIAVKATPDATFSLPDDFAPQVEQRSYTVMPAKGEYITCRTTPVKRKRKDSDAASDTHFSVQTTDIEQALQTLVDNEVGRARGGVYIPHDAPHAEVMRAFGEYHLAALQRLNEDERQETEQQERRALVSELVDVVKKQVPSVAFSAAPAFGDETVMRSFLNYLKNDDSRSVEARRLIKGLLKIKPTQITNKVKHCFESHGEPLFNDNEEYEVYTAIDRIKARMEEAEKEYNEAIEEAENDEDAIKAAQDELEKKKRDKWLAMGSIGGSIALLQVLFPDNLLQRERVAAFK